MSEFRFMLPHSYPEKTLLCLGQPGNGGKVCDTFQKDGHSEGLEKSDRCLRREGILSGGHLSNKARPHVTSQLASLEASGTISKNPGAQRCCMSVLFLP